jgi:ADP-ribose pyrophosphatase YjhB (NUDIX family)
MADNRFASVGAIVLKDKNVLLVRHTYGGAKGQLLNPSGFIKQGEMPYEALKREVLEETGIEISVKGLLAVRCSVKDWWLVFLADYNSGTARSDNNENNEVLFMPCEEAITHPDVTDATKTLIKIALNNCYLPVNDEYANIPSSNGRMMFSH